VHLTYIVTYLVSSTKEVPEDTYVASIEFVYTAMGQKERCYLAEKAAHGFQCIDK
jgi:hypothetical protein